MSPPAPPACSDYRRQAAPLITVPYRIHGETRDGWDCLGAVRWVRQEFGGLPSPGFLTPFTALDALNPGRAEVVISQNMAGWTECDPAPLAVLLLERMGHACHVGVLLDRGRWFLHAHPSRGTCLDRVDVGPWRRRLRGFYESRHPVPGGERRVL